MNRCEELVMDAVGVIWNKEKSETERVAGDIRQFLQKRGMPCHTATDGSQLPDECGCALVLGGDGTLLRAAKSVIDRQLPLLGVNLGHLGYLAELEVGRIEPALEKLLQADYSIERRMMLHGRVYRKDRRIYDDIALNDIVLTRTAPLRAFQLLNFVNGAHLNTCSADGEIVSTATGSTGYNLSVGGPIVSPEAELILLTPLAPHSLISRSIIFSGRDHIRVEIGEGSTGALDQVAFAAYDGTGEIPIGTGDAVEIRRSRKYTNIIKINNISFLEVLRRKMSEA